MFMVIYRLYFVIFFLVTLLKVHYDLNTDLDRRSMFTTYKCTYGTHTNSAYLRLLRSTEAISAPVLEES